MPKTIWENLVTTVMAISSCYETHDHLFFFSKVAKTQRNDCTSQIVENAKKALLRNYKYNEMSAYLPFSIICLFFHPVNHNSKFSAFILLVKSHDSKHLLDKNKNLISRIQRFNNYDEHECQKNDFHVIYLKKKAYYLN